MGVCFALVAGCSTTPATTPAPQSLPDAPLTTPETPASPTQALRGQWDGRLSLKLAAFGGEAASGVTLAFELEVQGQAGTLNLSTPMGTRVAAVRWQPGRAGALLETSEGLQQFDSLDSLTRQVLGEALPLDAMLHWLNGQPAPALPLQQPTAAPGTFVQAGWQVDASRLSEGRLEATRPGTDHERGVTLRLRLDL